MTANPGRIVAFLALLTAVVAAAILLAAGPGTRMGWWTFRTGLGMLQWAAWAAIGAMGLGLIGVVLAGGRSLAAVALLAGVAVFAVPWTFRRHAQAVPPIHDITTDTQDPPRMVALLSRRQGATNQAEYGGAEVAAQQHKAYSDLAPIALEVPPATAFERALAAARSLGWEIAASDPGEGRIEATDTTRWFGFKDDVVVRVRAAGTHSRIDVRSVSRVGRSDVGANAARIRRFRDALVR